MRPTTAEEWDEFHFDLLLALHEAQALSTAEVVGGLVEHIRDDAAEEHLRRLSPLLLQSLADFCHDPVVAAELEEKHPGRLDRLRVLFTKLLPVR